MNKFKTTPVKNRLEDWKIMRRKGRNVRWFNRVTAQWSGWEPDPEPPLTNSFKAVANTLHSMLLEQMTVATLRELARSQGVSFTTKTRKADLVLSLS